MTDITDPGLEAYARGPHDPARRPPLAVAEETRAHARLPRR